MKQLDLQKILCDILECPLSGKETRAHFQPPPNVKLVYPAIVYNLQDIPTIRADNRLYKYDRLYTLTLMDKRPNSPLVDKLMELSTIEFDRSFRSGDLNHWVYTIY